jgi:hypothetical protein
MYCGVLTGSVLVDLAYVHGTNGRDIRMVEPAGIMTEADVEATESFR